MFLIYGYWIDNEEPFDGYLVSEFDSSDSEDDDIFYYGLDEASIIAAISNGENTTLDFVITSYEAV